MNEKSRGNQHAKFKEQKKKKKDKAGPGKNKDAKVNVEDDVKWKSMKVVMPEACELHQHGPRIIEMCP